MADITHISDSMPSTSTGASVESAAPAVPAASMPAADAETHDHVQTPWTAPELMEVDDDGGLMDLDGGDTTDEESYEVVFVQPKELPGEVRPQRADRASPGER